MKKLSTIFVLSMFIAIGAIAQNETTVPGGVLNALNDAVLAADSGDVLILEAGQIYPNEGSIDIAVDITIMGMGSIEEGNLPYIKEVSAADGTWANQTLQVLSTFKLYNVFFNGFRGGEESELNARAIRVNEPIDTLIIEGCVFEQYRKRTVALNKPVVDYTSITNTIFNHNWKLSGMDEGRGFDMRNGGHGTVIIENCTFVASSDRHIRHQKWGANKAPVVKELIINQCTFLNAGNYRPTFSFWSVENLVFTNNMIGNYALFGTDTISIRILEIPYLEGSDAVTTFGPVDITPFCITEVDSFNTTVTMTNNNIFQEDYITALFDDMQEVWMPQQLFNNEALTIIDETSVGIEEVVTFTNVPAVPVNMIKQYGAMCDTVTHGTHPSLHPDYDIEYMKYDQLDLSYDATSESATAATDGGPLGDRRWMQKITGIEDHLAMESQLKLIQNYPNPFSTSTTIRFMLQEASDVNITLYNAVGAKVRMVSDHYYSQGLNEVTLDRGNLNAGIYFLELSSQKATDLIKLTVK